MKDIIVLGAIGNTPRQNRDNMRVLSGGVRPVYQSRKREDKCYTKKKQKVVGQMDNTTDHTFESANRIYDKRYCCPTIPTCGGVAYNQR